MGIAWLSRPNILCFAVAVAVQMVLVCILLRSNSSALRRPQPALLVWLLPANQEAGLAQPEPVSKHSPAVAVVGLIERKRNAARTQAPAVGAPPAAESSTNGTISTEPSTPSLDVEAIRARFRDEQRKEGLARRQLPSGLRPSDHEIETATRLKMDRDIALPQRADCNTTYAGMGLFAVVPLAVDAVTGKGCRWYSEGDRDALKKYGKPGG